MAEDEGKGRLDKLQMFEGREIRSVWVEEEEDWYFSVIDVITAVTDSMRPRKYWSDLKKKLINEEKSQLSENIGQLKMRSPKDGKYYRTDAANTEQVLRLVQSIPSPKAEPSKLWLAEEGDAHR